MDVAFIEHQPYFRNTYLQGENHNCEEDEKDIIFYDNGNEGSSNPNDAQNQTVSQQIVNLSPQNQPVSSLPDQNQEPPMCLNKFSIKESQIIL